MTASIVQYKSATGYFTAGAAQSQGEAKPARGLVVIQEWWGLTDQIKRTADRYAKQGYLVFAPDLYHGRTAATSDEAHHLMGGLDWPRAVEEIAMAAQYLKQQGAQKVGVVGYCMGGALTIAACVRMPADIDAIAPFYGIPPAKFADPSQIKVPVQAHFGTSDDQMGFSDPETAKQLKAKLEQSGTTFEFHWYEGASHAFTNELRPEVYHAEYAEQSFQRTLDFFNRHL